MRRKEGNSSFLKREPKNFCLLRAAPNWPVQEGRPSFPSYCLRWARNALRSPEFSRCIESRCHRSPTPVASAASRRTRIPATGRINRANSRWATLRSVSLIRALGGTTCPAASRRNASRSWGRRAGRGRSRRAGRRTFRLRWRSAPRVIWPARGRAPPARQPARQRRAMRCRQGHRAPVGVGHPGFVGHRGGGGDRRCAGTAGSGTASLQTGSGGAAE